MARTTHRMEQIRTPQPVILPNADISPKTTDLRLQAVIHDNCLSRVGHQNYNAYGVQDGRGLEKATPLFCDNFLLKVLVADYQITVPEGKDARSRKYQHVNAHKKNLVKELSEAGLAEVKVDLARIGEAIPRDQITSKLLGALLLPDNTKRTADTKYHWQEYKVACPNENVVKVLRFLHDAAFVRFGMFLKDVDLTVDWGGSFDKADVIAHLVGTGAFQLADERGTWAENTILLNDASVGRNCLTYMTTVGGLRVRCKLYLKMVQELEKQSVKCPVGNHMFDWVTELDTRLAKARDETTDRGLTRAEVTVSLDGDPFTAHAGVPTLDNLQALVHGVVAHVPAHLVYTTPHSAMWRAYCDGLRHTLVAVNVDTDSAIFALHVNEVTNTISGYQINAWSAKRQWCMKTLSLGQALPVDVIYLEGCHAATDGDDNDAGPVDIVHVGPGAPHAPQPAGSVLITSRRFFRFHANDGTECMTYVVHKQNVAAYVEGSKEANAAKLVQAGLVPHPHCVPELACTQHTWKSNPKEIEFKESKHRLPPNVTRLITPTAQKRLSRQRYLPALQREREALVQAAILERAAMLAEIQELRRLEAAVQRMAALYSQQAVRGMGVLKAGSYELISIRAITDGFNKKTHTLFLRREDGEQAQLQAVYANQAVNAALSGIPPRLNDTLRVGPGGYLMLLDAPLGTLHITGRTWKNTYGTTSVDCRITIQNETILETRSVHAAQITRRQLEQTAARPQVLVSPGQQAQPLPVIPQEDLPLPKCVGKLLTKPLLSIHAVTRTGTLTHYGKPHFILELAPNAELFFAGPDLESKQDQLTQGCKIQITAHKARHAACTVGQAGDWAAFVDYGQDTVPLYKNALAGRTELKIMDVKTVDAKRGQKRALLLGEDSTVYSFTKRSKLSDAVAPGDTIDLATWTLKK